MSFTETNHHIKVQIEIERFFTFIQIFFTIFIIFHYFHQLNEKIMVMVLITFDADLELAGIT